MPSKSSACHVSKKRRATSSGGGASGVGVAGGRGVGVSPIILLHAGNKVAIVPTGMSLRKERRVRLDMIGHP